MSKGRLLSQGAQLLFFGAFRRQISTIKSPAATAVAALSLPAHDGQTVARRKPCNLRHSFANMIAIGCLMRGQIMVCCFPLNGGLLAHPENVPCLRVPETTCVPSSARH
jgi:hypothetical protein